MRGRTTMIEGLLTYQAKVFDGSSTFYFEANATSYGKFQDKVKTWYAENVDPAKAYTLEYSEITNAGRLALPVGATLIKL